MCIHGSLVNTIMHSNEGSHLYVINFRGLHTQIEIINNWSLLCVQRTFTLH